MVKNVYSIRDNKIGTFAPPCLFDNDATAIRAFGDMVSHDKDGLIGLHPEDFNLWLLGTIDISTGIISQNPETMCIIAAASDFKKVC